MTPAFAGLTSPITGSNPAPLRLVGSRRRVNDSESLALIPASNLPALSLHVNHRTLAGKTMENPSKNAAGSGRAHFGGNKESVAANSLSRDRRIAASLVVPLSPPLRKTKFVAVTTQPSGHRNTRRLRRAPCRLTVVIADQDRVGAGREGGILEGVASAGD